MNHKNIFKIKTEDEFLSTALSVFHHQYANNSVYRAFCQHLNVLPKKVTTLHQIPFLPIQFFKEKQILSTTESPQITFTSSGTTGTSTSKHFVTDINLYTQSYYCAFQQFYGSPEDYCILALLPSYLEREGSSLIYMVNDLIEKSNHPKSGFFLNDFENLKDTLEGLKVAKTKTLLIGVSFALLDFSEQYHLELKETIIMETGGMKGRRKEMIRPELHEKLKFGFGVDQIHSEYGMTELLSQAYSTGKGIFACPPWMKVLSRDTEDALTINGFKKTGGLNIIDLANINSCSFIATQDLGKTYADGTFEILGRFDHSDIRGCNLMAL
ncbi:acyl transferase [Maribacter sp. MJ134]|uniref:LuxE/PaaK family acyltransferase n=1 Tax=Maribacter sp. MJ134 TaxID=2496865 RepID=UPI000F81C4FD|nr:acyl transferase [Maribacter sp. MJ134]AZQ60159.1 acyl transferase [Maribacter sp. MJ134]